MERDNGKEVMRLFTGAFSSGETLLSYAPAERVFAAWSKEKVSYLSFSCKSTKATAVLRFCVVVKGKPFGSPASFLASPGDWQRVYIPTAKLGKDALARAEGLAFQVMETENDNDVLITDMMIGNTPYTQESWDGRRMTISLSGDWRFATDQQNKGLDSKWNVEDFDDSKWQTLKTGSSWEKQGVPSYSGYGWYRQKLLVPKECEGTPIKLTFAHFTGDDDVYVNGTHIGGITGEYRNADLATRTYTAPPSLIHYGAINMIAVRIWGGNLGFQVANSGMVEGIYTALLDPYEVKLSKPHGEEQAPSLYDLSSAQKGEAFELVFRFPGEILKSGTGTLHYHVTDFYGRALTSGVVPVKVDKDGIARGVVPIEAVTAQSVYLRGRFKTDAVLCDETGQPLYVDADDSGHAVDHLNFTDRDTLSLPALPETEEETPYGRLRLVDEIDSSLPLTQEPHPYMQSGFDSAQKSSTPGSPVHVMVNDILGKKARESDNGWFAYRLGRGKLNPHQNYLVRIEYAEDKPRYCPVLIEAGHYYMCIGWKNGLTPTDPYDNWPLSHQWQWYDAIVSLDDFGLGSQSTGSVSSENGFWVYLINKIVPNGNASLYQGGPAIARIKLYEIDPNKNAPVIQEPQGVPKRVFMVDWEHQPNHDPVDLVRYAKLMGYSAVSPSILKWGFGNYGSPLTGYETTNVDDKGYWVRDMYDPTVHIVAQPAIPGKNSIHDRYLAATKQFGIDYIPRLEYGGSYDLPDDARAIAVNGKPAKPNRFATWSSDLLQPAVFDDLAKLMDHLVKPYVGDNPQFTGVLWRIRCDRMPISYSRADLDLFTHDSGTSIPGKSDLERAAWAGGKGKQAYDDWWHQKRRDFHVKLADLLKSYQPDLTLYYYNWDNDKWSLIQPPLESWGFLSKVVNAPPGMGTAAYVSERADRSKLTGDDYIRVLRSGDFSSTLKVNRADYAVRPELYKDVKGMELFAPANELFFANDPVYLNYFKTGDGLAVSNAVSYDEVGYKTINRRYECNMITPAGSNFSMALEVLACFHSDPRTLTYTTYTFGRGFADAHRRFAQAYRALPALEGTVVEGIDPDIKVRLYKTENGTYVGVVYKGYAARKLTIHLPGVGKPGATVTNLITKAVIPATTAGDGLEFEIESGPMELHSYLVR